MATSTLVSSHATHHHRVLPQAISAPRSVIFQHPHPKPLSILQLLLIISVFFTTGVILYFFNSILLEVKKAPARTIPVQNIQTPKKNTTGVTPIY